MGNPPALPGRQQKFDRSGSPRGKRLLMSQPPGIRGSRDFMDESRWPDGTGKGACACFLALPPSVAAMGRYYGNTPSVGAAHGRDEGTLSSSQNQSPRLCRRILKLMCKIVLTAPLMRHNAKPPYGRRYSVHMQVQFVMFS